MMHRQELAEPPHAVTFTESITQLRKAAGL